MISADLSIQKLPPQNIEAEQAVLAAILLDNQAINKVVEVLQRDDFYKESHRKIFEAMLELNERSEAIDSITLSDHLLSKNQLDAVGGDSYLTDLLNSVATAANVRMHAKIVHEKALLRNLISIATEIVTVGYESQGKVEDLLDHAERSIFAIADKKLKGAFTP